MDVAPTRFCVDTLLPRGFSILGGAPKVGKSWLALQLCVAAASGQPPLFPGAGREQQE